MDIFYCTDTLTSNMNNTHKLYNCISENHSHFQETFSMVETSESISTDKCFIFFSEYRQIVKFLSCRRCLSRLILCVPLITLLLWEGWARKPVNHTSWVAVVTPTDRSVRNRCVIEFFCVVTLPF